MDLMAKCGISIARFTTISDCVNAIDRINRSSTILMYMRNTFYKCAAPTYDEQGYRALLSFIYGHFVSFKLRCGSFRQYYRCAKELLYRSNSYYVYCITWRGNSDILRTVTLNERAEVLCHGFDG